jgi:hypothetical protein
MKLPAYAVVLPNELVCPAADVPRRVWQRHIVKHPLGIHRETARDGSLLPWDREGWTSTEPPVVAAGDRERALQALASLTAAGGACAVPEVRGREGSRGQDECARCPSPVVGGCDHLVERTIPIGPRYAAAAQSALDVLREGVQAPRSTVFNAIWRLARRLDTLRPFVVLSVGLGGPNGDLPLARINCGDGRRVEFFLTGRTMAWRTTYRMPDRHVGSYLSFITDFARLGGNRLSETCLVARPWWEEHGL